MNAAGPGNDGEGGASGSARSLLSRIDGDALRNFARYTGLGVFVVFAFLVCAYLTFPYDRIRDRIVADFQKSQKALPNAPHQTLSIGSLKLSWLTGVVLTDVVLTTVPPDPTKAPTVIHVDEVRARLTLGTLFAATKDLSFQIKAMGGTIEGTISHSKSTEVESPTTKRPAAIDPKKMNEPQFDRTIKAEIDGIDLAQVGPLREAIGVPLGGTLKGSIDLTLVGDRVDHASGTINLDIDNFWVSDGKVPFKVPALKAAFNSDEITLPQINIGAVPVQVTVKGGVAHVDKMAASGKDLDLQVDGQIVLREIVAESELGLGLRFKFNDSYRKKGDTTSGLLMLLDSEPKLKAGKRADGFYGLRVTGPLGGAPLINPAPAVGGAGALAPAAAKSLP